MWEWAYIGVNGSVPGNGGPECAAYINPKIHLIETIYTTVLAALLIAWGYRRLNMYAPPDYTTLVHPPLQELSRHRHQQQHHHQHSSAISSSSSNNLQICYSPDDLLGRKCMLVLYCLIWGVEIGFKFASQTVLYLLNPCHLVTVMQIYLLAGPPNKYATGTFRWHLNYLNGAILAFVFPVTESRKLPFETVTYWLQHSMMLVTPLYLLKMGGAYTTEPVRDLSWNAISYGVILLYHFVFLCAVGLPTQVNLNHMLCPMPSDPFYGPWWRSFAVFHQALLCPISSKIYCILQASIYKPQPPPKEQDVNNKEVCDNAQCKLSHRQPDGNHLHYD